MISIVKNNNMAKKHIPWNNIEQDIFLVKKKIKGKKAIQIARAMGKEFKVKRSQPSINTRMSVLRKRHDPNGKNGDEYILEQLQKGIGFEPKISSSLAENRGGKSHFFWGNYEYRIYLEGRINRNSSEEIAKQIKKELGYTRTISSVNNILFRLKKKYNTGDFNELLEIINSEMDNAKTRISVKTSNFQKGLVKIITDFDNKYLSKRFAKRENLVYSYLKNQADNLLLQENALLLKRYLNTPMSEVLNLQDTEKKDKIIEMMQSYSGKPKGIQILEALDVILIQSFENHALLPIYFNSLEKDIKEGNNSSQKVFYDAFMMVLDDKEYAPFGKDSFREIVKINYKNRINKENVSQLKETISSLFKGYDGLEKVELNISLDAPFYSFCLKNFK